MSDCIVAKAVLDLQETQNRLTQLTELMNEAFIVFDYESIAACKLPDVTKVVENSWVKFTHYPIEFSERDYNKIHEASIRVSRAFITREDFNNLLATYKSAIEEYSSKLTAEVEKKRQHIIKLYDNFEQFNTSQLAFIFKQEEIKEIFMQFVMF